MKDATAEFFHNEVKKEIHRPPKIEEIFHDYHGDAMITQAEIDALLAGGGY